MQFLDLIEYSPFLEQVVVVCRDATAGSKIKTSPNQTFPDAVETFKFDYCEKIKIVGYVRNPLDFDDMNWGA